MTVAGNPAPPANPTDATEAPYFIWPNTLANIAPPTASIQPAQVSDSNGLLTVSLMSSLATI